MNSIRLLVISLSLLFIIGCVYITQDSAQKAIDDAYSAIEMTKFSNADNPSDNLKKAERLLADAEEALKRNRRQRAYTLANKSIEMAKLAQEETYTSDHQVDQIYKETLALPDKAEIVKEETPLASQKQRIPQIVIQETTPIDVNLLPSVKTEVSTSDVQNRIKAAIQALEEAQNAVQSARLLMFKTQTEIGLSSANATVQQVRENGAPIDVVNMIQSRYDQARKVAAEGNFEAAVMLIEQAQIYARAFLKPVE